MGLVQGLLVKLKGLWAVSIGCSNSFLERKTQTFDPHASLTDKHRFSNEFINRINRLY